MAARRKVSGHTSPVGPARCPHPSHRDSPMRRIHDQPGRLPLRRVEITQSCVDRLWEDADHVVSWSARGGAEGGSRAGAARREESVMRLFGQAVSSAAAGAAIIGAIIAATGEARAQSIPYGTLVPGNAAAKIVQSTGSWCAVEGGASLLPPHRRVGGFHRRHRGVLHRNHLSDGLSPGPRRGAAHLHRGDLRRHHLRSPLRRARSGDRPADLHLLHRDLGGREEAPDGTVQRQGSRLAWCATSPVTSLREVLA